jgi:hypothetical protein
MRVEFEGSDGGRNSQSGTLTPYSSAKYVTTIAAATTLRSQAPLQWAPGLILPLTKKNVSLNTVALHLVMSIWLN